MVPSDLVFLESFPLTPNGKVDRKALPAPEGLMARDEDYVAPRTPTEEILAGIWREALGVDEIGPHDNFFDLGGHSLLAARVLAQIEKRTGRRIGFREIVLQTLEQLASGLESGVPDQRSEPARTPGLIARLAGALQGLRPNSRPRDS
jgi:acyl carrier protein